MPYIVVGHAALTLAVSLSQLYAPRTIPRFMSLGPGSPNRTYLAAVYLNMNLLGEVPSSNSFTNYCTATVRAGVKAPLTTLNIVV